ncbi:MAG: hypothetical protein KAH01_03250 [Caldisericia bacterium]|nr:hypothetical protein [Caldisericia bacterium]
MKKFFVVVLSMIIGTFALFPSEGFTAVEKIIPQSNFMIPVVCGSTSYVEVPFTNLFEGESKYTVSITRKLPKGFDMKIEINGFSVQEKYDVGPFSAEQKGTLGIRVFCNETSEPEKIVSAKILIGSIENSKLSSIVNVFVKAMPSTKIVMHTDNADAIVNEKPEILSTPPVVINGRTLVPFRWIGEQLGADVSFTMSSETKKVDTVSYKIGKSTITLAIGSTDAVTEINREKIQQTLDVAPFIKDGRTLVPLRFVSETLGADVFWTPPNTIGIEYPKEVPIQENECVCFWTEISGTDLQKLMDTDEDFMILDVRDQESYDRDHVAGAKNIFVEVLPVELEKATSETENLCIVLYCKTGTYSKQAAEYVVNAGYKNVKSLINGYAGWKGDVEKPE